MTNGKTTHAPPSQTKKRSLNWIGWLVFGLILTLVTVYFLTPVVTRYLIVNAVEKQGMTQVKFEKFEWQPWTPSLTISGLSWKTPSLETVTLQRAFLQLQWDGLLSQEIAIRALEIDGMQIPIHLTPTLNIAGFNASQKQNANGTMAQPSTSNATPWNISADLVKINNSEVTLDGIPTPEGMIAHRHTLEIKEIVTQTFSTLHPEQKTSIEFTGALDGVGFNFSSNAAVLDSGQAMSGTLNILHFEPFHQTRLYIAEDLLHGIDGKAGLKSKITIDHQLSNTERMINFDLDFNVPNFDSSISRSLTERVDIHLEQLDLNISGALRISPSQFSVKANANMGLESLSASTEGGLGVTLNNIQFDAMVPETQGQFTALEQTQLIANNRLQMSDFKISTVESPDLLKYTYFLTTMDIEGRQLRIPSLVVENLYFNDASQPLTSRLELNDLFLGRNQLGEKELQINKVAIDAFSSTITLEQDGRINSVKTIESLTEQILQLFDRPGIDEIQPHPQRENTPTPMLWSINELIFNEPKVFTFQDNRDEIKVEHNFNLETLELKDLGLSAATQVNFKTQYQENGSISATGQITLADVPANSDLRIHIDEINIPALSPYLAPAIGYSAVTGQLRGNYTLGYKAGEGSSQLNLYLAKLTLKSENNQITAALAKDLTMPLDIALSLIKDKDDSIKLEVPIDVSSQGIKTNIKSVIRQALTRATKNATLTYLKFAMQPYGSIIMLAEQSEKLINQMQLINIQFDEMSAVMGEAQIQPANKIIQLLRDKPKLTVRLCPIATQQEASTWPEEAGKDYEEALMTLARQRAHSLKRHLTNADISSDRLFICAPEVKAEGSGQVYISL